MNAFELGRMRHLDLLALWHELNPDGHQRHQLAIAQLSTGQLVRQILGTT